MFDFQVDCAYGLCFILPIIAVLLIGISKAGFGGGVGLVTTPLLSLLFPARIVVGFLLPLLIIADWFTLYHYRREWDWGILKKLLPGALVGIMLGSLFVDVISDVQLKRTIGIVAMLFLVLQYFRSTQHRDRAYIPVWWHGILAGFLAGFISAIAHSAGIIIAMFLLPQQLPKRTYVATMALFFALVNLLKVPPYVMLGLINFSTLKAGLLFILFIPIGVKLGVWLNQKVSQQTFMRVVYVLVFLIAMQLLIGKSLFQLFM